MVTYSGQIGQDFLLDSAVFQGMRDGVFVDIGAHDGTTLSNTLVFERERGWRGLCIEPNPAVFTALTKARKVPTLNVAVGAENGILPFRQVTGHSEMLSGLADTASPDHMARVEREVARFGGNTTIIDVPVRRLDDILAEYGIDEVHYLSIDTEGAERAILASLDHTRVFIHVVDVECNDRREAESIAAALGPAFAGLRHRHDLFFINRDSPFFGRRGALRRAIRGYAVRRRLAKLARLFRR